MVHTGIGYDVHPLVEGRRLILGGVHIPYTKGLQGHSDADVLIHAICDAILGALGEGDIGFFFPNSDPRWRNAESRIFLEEAGRIAQAKGGRIVNVDSTLIAEQPKVLPYREAMKMNLARSLGLELRQVGIKATTNEHLGFIGRGEGIAALAVAAIDLP
jgi:2-C-methyl-D-erythritol 2,4-cyclodiphosphate synthase